MASSMRTRLPRSWETGQGTKWFGGRDRNSNQRLNLMVLRTHESTIVFSHWSTKRLKRSLMGGDDVSALLAELAATSPVEGTSLKAALATPKTKGLPVLLLELTLKD